MYLGLNIKTLRKKRKLSQSELGELLNITNSQVSAYESEKSEPPVSKVIQMADLFKVSVQDLLLTDLSSESPQFKEPEVPYGQQEEGKVIAELNNELRKRLIILEHKLKELDPELAKDWGIE